MFSVGDKVVHTPEGVCIVEAICNMEVEKEQKQFYMLRSIMENTKVFYVPVDSQKGNFRPLKTREEVENLLRIEPAEKQFFHLNMQRRISVQNQAIYSDDSVLLIRLIKLYLQKKQQTNLSVNDKNWLKKAEQYFFSEVAEVLKCEYEAVVESSNQMSCC